MTVKDSLRVSNMRNQTIENIKKYKINYEKNFFFTKNNKKENIIKNYILSSLKAII